MSLLYVAKKLSILKQNNFEKKKKREKNIAI